MIDKSNQILNKLIDLTYGNKIKWKNEKPTVHSEKIFNSNYVFRLHSTEIGEFKVLFIEKKVPRICDEYNEAIDSYQPELMIMHEGKIANYFIEGDCDRDDIIRLSAAIESKDPNIDNFINSMDIF